MLIGELQLNQKLDHSTSGILVTLSSVKKQGPDVSIYTFKFQKAYKDHQLPVGYHVHFLLFTQGGTLVERPYTPFLQENGEVKFLIRF